MNKTPHLSPWIEDSGQGHVVVLVHGMRQGAGNFFQFATQLTRGPSPPFDVYIYDYDWTRPLAKNGQDLASHLDALKYSRIDIVGYSMGGLVARVAAARYQGEALRTVVTLATPNRGAVRTSDLTNLMHLGVRHWLLSPVISPLAIRSPGIQDLMRADQLMLRERNTLTSASPPKNLVGLRYGSVPALFYHANRPVNQLSPSKLMSSVAVAIAGVLKILPRPHDGIVAEASANLTAGGSADWAEFDLCRDATKEHLPLCHAVPMEAVDHDHVSILGSARAIDLIREMVTSNAWEDLRSNSVLARSVQITLATPR